MGTRHLYLARHGEADAFGALTATGRRQSGLLGERLAHVPVDVVHHSPLPRAAAAAREVACHLPGVPVVEAAELVDHVPHVPDPADAPPAWRGFFDGYGATEAAAGRALADALVARFASPAPPTTVPDRDTHEVLVTHAYPIAWLVRHALDAPPARWLGLESAHAALTVIEVRPGVPPTLVAFNDQGHLPRDLRWTGFGRVLRP